MVPLYILSVVLFHMDVLSIYEACLKLHISVFLPQDACTFLDMDVFTIKTDGQLNKISQITQDVKDFLILAEFNPFYIM